MTNTDNNGNTLLLSLLSLPCEERRKIFLAMSSREGIKELVGKNDTQAFKVCAEEFIKCKVDISWITTEAFSRLRDCRDNLADINRKQMFVHMVKAGYKRYAAQNDMGEDSVSAKGKYKDCLRSSYDYMTDKHKEAGQLPVADEISDFKEMFKVCVYLSNLEDKVMAVNCKYGKGRESCLLWDDSDVKFILDADADFNACNLPKSYLAEDYRGYNSIHRILKTEDLYYSFDCLKQIEEMLAELKVNQEKFPLKEYGYSILFGGLSSRNYDTVKYALELGIDPNMTCSQVSPIGLPCFGVNTPFLFMTLPFNYFNCEVGSAEEIKKHLSEAETGWFENELRIQEEAGDEGFNLHVPFSPVLADLLRGYGAHDTVSLKCYENDENDYEPAESGEIIGEVFYSDMLISGASLQIYGKSIFPDAMDIPVMYEYLEHTSFPLGTVRENDITLPSEVFFLCLQDKVIPEQFKKAYSFSFYNDSVNWDRVQSEYLFLKDFFDFIVKHAAVFDKPLSFEIDKENKNNKLRLIKYEFNELVELIINIRKYIDTAIDDGGISWQELKNIAADDFSDALISKIGEHYRVGFIYEFTKFKNLIFMLNINVDSEKNESNTEVKVKAAIIDLYDHVLLERKKLFGRKYNYIKGGRVAPMFDKSGNLNFVQTLYWNYRVKSYAAKVLRKLSQLFAAYLREAAKNETGQYMH